MERLVIEGICNKKDIYRKSLTGRTKQTVFKFFRQHKVELKEYNIDFLLSDWFFSCLEPDQNKWFFSLLIDVFPQSLIQKFFNELINYSEFANYYYVLLHSVTIDKLFIEANMDSDLMFIKSDIATLDCKFYQEEGLKDFLNNCKEVNIQRLILDESFSLDKEDIEKLLSTNGSSAKEIIFKK